MRALRMLTPSMVRVSMTMTALCCSYTICRKSATVLFLGPCTCQHACRWPHALMFCVTSCMLQARKCRSGAPELQCTATRGWHLAGSPASWH
jgi:hypothetical protein